MKRSITKAKKEIKSKLDAIKRVSENTNMEGKLMLRFSYDHDSFNTALESIEGYERCNHFVQITNKLGVILFLD